MAKKAKTETNEANGHGVSAIRGNGYDPEAVKSFIERIENVIGDINKERSESMLRCKTMRSNIDEIYKEAKNAGLRKKALKAEVKKRGLERDLEAIRDDLEGEDQDDFDKIEQALGKFGDTPLGSSALARAGAQNGSTAARA